MKRSIAIIPFLLLAACRHEGPNLEKTLTPVRVAAVDLYQPKSVGRYSASILPGRQVSLAFRVSGIVTGVHQTAGRGLEPGDIVSAGTVLARLREEDYRNSTAQAQSQLDAAREAQKSARAQFAQADASHRKAEADFARAKTLIESQSLTRPDFDAAKAQYDVTAAQVDAARAQIDATAAQIRTAETNIANARLNEGDTALAAPFTAAVVQRNVEVGMMAGPSLAAYTLADIATVKAAFGVPDTVAVELHPGKNIALTVEALPASEFRGIVTAVASVADSETRLFQVEVSLANPRLLLKPGMIASLTLGAAASGPASVPVVPVSAVVRDRENPADFDVMVVEDKVARARRVTLGPAFGDVLAVTSGVKPGELVIRAGATMVTDGEKVEVIP
ncbi:MAG TPA: efflux RND transporter periplasmic adaptor subunit [Bryobacteraceae bacterium]|nr:efflux RND transporter periplasmic adaptor subunit [Bryobacteraceae bacterium]